MCSSHTQLYDWYVYVDSDNFCQTISSQSKPHSNTSRIQTASYNDTAYLYEIGDVIG